MRTEEQWINEGVGVGGWGGQKLGHIMVIIHLVSHSSAKGFVTSSVVNLIVSQKKDLMQMYVQM